MRSYTETISKFCFVFVVGIVSLVSVAAFPVIGPEVDLTPHSGLLRRDTNWKATVRFLQPEVQRALSSEIPATLKAYIVQGILSKLSQLSPGDTADIKFTTAGLQAFDDDDMVRFEITWKGNGKKDFITDGHVYFKGDKGDRQVMYEVEAGVPTDDVPTVWKATVFFDDPKVFFAHSKSRRDQVHKEIKKAVKDRLKEGDTVDIIFNSPGIPAFKGDALQFHIHWNEKYKTAGKFELVGEKFKVTPKVTLETECEAISPAGTSTTSASAPSINIIEVRYEVFFC
ncbi:hypothetical protein DFH05DRAFT_183188 [Lentinula detonsa]|uniref:Uncharacterized protein n=1 Tax=Lentinula detonsa TaxID=2804962 RepID=A0A9W8PCQ9_9AGAR|nr:hypothetical protein DFH05DRAFT_183188 [Lentinula detonsa]